MIQSSSSSSSVSSSPAINLPIEAAETWAQTLNATLVRHHQNGRASAFGQRKFSDLRINGLPSALEDFDRCDFSVENWGPQAVNFGRLHLSAAEVAHFVPALLERGMEILSAIDLAYVTSSGAPLIQLMWMKLCWPMDWARLVNEAWSITCAQVALSPSAVAAGLPTIQTARQSAAAQQRGRHQQLSKHQQQAPVTQAHHRPSGRTSETNNRNRLSSLVDSSPQV